MEILDRAAPHSIEIEEAILSACLVDEQNEVIHKCLEQRVSAESFYKPSHQVMWDAMSSIYGDKGFIDELVLAEYLKNKNTLEAVGGYASISRIAQYVDLGVMHRVDEWLRILVENDQKRKIIRFASVALDQCHISDEGSDDILAEVNSSIMTMTTPKGKTLRKSREVMDKVVKNIQTLREKPHNVIGLSSGLIDLDDKTLGFKPQEMTVIAGRPSLGKTSLTMNIAEYNAIPSGGEQPVGVLIFTLEQSTEALASRMTFSRARVVRDKYFSGFYAKNADAQVFKAIQEIREAPLIYEERADISGMEIRSTARHTKAKEATLGLVIVDYLQLARSIVAKELREQTIANLSRDMKAMSKELDLPVLVLSQLNRECEIQKRRPRLSDLRESGSLEQDTDIVILISKDTEDDNKRILNVAKNRW